MIRVSFLLIILSAAVFTCRAQQAPSKKCINYEPEVVTLVGTMVRRTFFDANDHKEVMWVIKLAKPVCVNATDDDAYYPRRPRVTDIQLVFNGSGMYDKYRHLLGKRIRATGTLFPQNTAHHHTAVLLTVTDIVSAR